MMFGIHSKNKSNYSWSEDTVELFRLSRSDLASGTFNNKEMLTIVIQYFVKVIMPPQIATCIIFVYLTENLQNLKSF
jgi:hypothetical protein